MTTQPDIRPTTPHALQRWAYPVLVGLPLLGLALVLVWGTGLTAPAPDAVERAARTPVAAVDATFRLNIFLAQIGVVIGVSRIVGKLLRLFGQPQVIGEMLAGLLLGPSILGFVSPEAYHLLFPAGSVRFLNAVSQLGLLMFMFLVGLELDPKSLRGQGHTAVLTSHVSIITPMFLGGLLALVLYPRLSTNDVKFVAFALFVGTALSVTAFPVLARLLHERKLEHTMLGGIAIACAAVDDVTAWCLLAGISAFAHPGEAVSTLALTLVGLAVFLAVAFFVVKPGLRMLVGIAARDNEVGQDALAAIIALVLLAAWITNQLGVHALFGAFMIGVVMPKEHELRESLRQRSEDFLLVLLLPLFFAVTGIRIHLELLNNAMGLLLLTIAAAILGKLGGAFVAARTSGLSARDGFALGALLNARGMVGLVVINVGLDAGVISPTVYAILIITALLTTAMASPLVALAHRGRRAIETEAVVAQ